LKKKSARKPLHPGGGEEREVKPILKKKYYSYAPPVKNKNHIVRGNQNEGFKNDVTEENQEKNEPCKHVSGGRGGGFGVCPTKHRGSSQAIYQKSDGKKKQRVTDAFRFEGKVRKGGDDS